MIKFILIGIACGIAIFYAYKFIVGDIETSEAAGGEPCISFDHFLAMYKVNPDKWRFKSTYSYFSGSYYTNAVIYAKPAGNYLYPHDDRTILYWEKLKDKRKFKRWIAKKEWDETVSRSNDAIKSVLTDVQNDIEERLKEIQSEKEKELSRIEVERQKNIKMEVRAK